MSDVTPSGPLPDPDGDDDLSPTARRLRDALAARAADARPTDRLEEIRMTSRATRRRSRARIAVAGAAAVVVVGGGAFALSQRDGDAVTTVAASTSPAPSSSSSASSSATTSPVPASSDPASPLTSTSGPVVAGGTAASGTPTGPALPAGTGAVPVYWTDGGKLFREFTKLPGQADDATRALQRVLGGEAADPDYGTAWGADPTARVSLDGSGHYVVDVSAAAASASLPRAAAELAVQQLVYTVTAATGDDAPVELRVDGKTGATVFGSYPVPATVSRAPQADVQAPAWITAVTPGTGSVTVEGVGTAFEGTLLYTLTDAAGAEVARGPVQAGANGTFGDFSFTAQVPAGTYTVAVFAPDESGGEGTPQVGDTKVVTVR